jgi:hypothetical protein
MKGPIDYIVVGFDGNKFDGSILKAIGDAIESGTIGLVALSVVIKDSNDQVTSLDIAASGDDYIVDFVEKYKPNNDLISMEDVDEVAELLEPNTSAGFLVIEHLWAKPLKKAIIDANGFLVAEGRIHPEALNELDKED